MVCQHSPSLSVPNYRNHNQTQEKNDLLKLQKSTVTEEKKNRKDFNIGVSMTHLWIYIPSTWLSHNYLYFFHLTLVKFLLLESFFEFRPSLKGKKINIYYWVHIIAYYFKHILLYLIISPVLLGRNHFTYFIEENSNSATSHS